MRQRGAYFAEWDEVNDSCNSWQLWRRCRAERGRLFTIFLAGPAAIARKVHDIVPILQGGVASIAIAGN
jgi:hypothetical protein